MVYTICTQTTTLITSIPAYTCLQPLPIELPKLIAASLLIALGAKGTGVTRAIQRYPFA